MKKIYALAAVAMMATTAMAQNGAPLYATGAGGFAGGEWAPATADEFTFANGEYTLEVPGLTQFKISTVQGEWPEFNAGALTCVYGTEKGVQVPLEAGDANIEAPWKGDYKITVAGDLSWVKLDTETKKPEGPVAIYFRGDMNNWGDDGVETLAPWELKPIDETETVYTLTCAEGQAIMVGETFKIADADWNKFNIGGYDDAPLLVGEDAEPIENALCSGSDPANMTVEAEWNGIAWLKNAGNNEWFLVLSNDKSTPNPFGDVQAVTTVGVDSNSEAVYYNLQGVRVNAAENGVFIVVKDGKAVKVVK